MHDLFLLLQTAPEEATPKPNLLSPSGGLMFSTLVI
jgi:hypothetical protein